MGEGALIIGLAIASALAAGLSGSDQPNTLTIGEVWFRHHELDGKPIRVRGIVTRCQSLGCPLQESTDRNSKWLGIGSSKSFDRRMSKLLGKEVVVEGRLRADCLHIYADPPSMTTRPEDGEATVVICTD